MFSWSKWLDTARIQNATTTVSILLLMISLMLDTGPLQLRTAAAEQPSLSTDMAGGNDHVRGLLVFRISEAFLRNEFERDVHRCSPVDRTIEGTRSRGTANTVAKVAVALQPQDEGIAFQLAGHGTVDTNTVGRNGRAIVHSNLRTTFSTQIPILFDGAAFKRGEQTLKTDSRLRILSVGSSTGGLRGRLLTRLASRRAAESRSRVEAIAACLTERELRSSIEKSADESVGKLNRRLQTRRLLSFVMRTAEGRWLRYSSSTDALRIAWYPVFYRDEVPLCPVDRGGNAAVQLWIHDNIAAAVGIDELPEIMEDFESWLKMLLPNVSLRENIPVPLAIPMPAIRLERIDEWFVVKIEPS